MRSDGESFRVLFAGTPDFALPSLDALAGVAGVELVACLTQPDRLVGRGAEPSPPPVKRWAQAHGVPILQPERLDGTAVEAIRDFHPDVVVLVAYGLIVPASLLSVPTRGWLNVHASLLPRWRGAAPIAHAIMAGDTMTGVTIMRLDEGLDTGPMLAHRSIPISPADATPTLTAKLSRLGATLLAQTLLPYLRGEIEPTPQPEEGVTLAPKLSKARGVVDWGRSAEEIGRLVRGLTPWPGVRTFVGEKELKLLDVEPIAGDPGGPPGSPHVGADDAIEVACGSGRLRLRTVQLESRRPMSAGEFLRGYRRLLSVPLGRSTAAAARGAPESSAPSPSR